MDGFRRIIISSLRESIFEQLLRYLSNHANQDLPTSEYILQLNYTIKMNILLI